MGVSITNLVRGLVVVSALLMLVGRVSLEPAAVMGLGLIISLPWIMMMYYSAGAGKRVFLASAAIALFFPIYALLLAHGFLP